MNLQENIQRIKEMMGVINESVSDIKSILKISSKGNDVESLQDLLGIHKDGNFGRQTKSCVQEFQRKMGIDDDGIVGNITKNKLKDLEDKKVEWVTPDFSACVLAPPKSSEVTSSCVTVLTTFGPVTNI